MNSLLPIDLIRNKPLSSASLLGVSGLHLPMIGTNPFSSSVLLGLSGPSRAAAPKFGLFDPDKAADDEAGTA